MTSIAEWTLDPEVRHVNHGSFGAVPRVAQAVQAALRTEMERNPVRWFRELPERIAGARAQVAGFLGVPAGDLALVPNASAGVTAVLDSPGVVAPGSTVVMTDHAYGAVAMGVRRAAEAAGAKVVEVAVPLGASRAEIVARIAEALDSGVSLLVVDQITSSTARLFPVGEISRAAHAVGARVLVDGAHAPGQLADPVAAAGADWWVGNLHKWPCAPRGTAALVASGEAAQLLRPLVDSWGAGDPFPARFDVQGTDDATGWLAAPHAIRFVEDALGWDAARARMSELAGAGQRLVCAALGVDPAAGGGCEAPAMRLVALPDGVASDDSRTQPLRNRIMDELGCVTAITAFGGRGWLRLSAHLYNTEDDYAFLAERLPGLLRTV